MLEVSVFAANDGRVADLCMENSVVESCIMPKFDFNFVCSSVKYSARSLTHNGIVFRVSWIAVATIWLDGKIYFGSSNAMVYVKDYNIKALGVSWMCHSIAMAEYQYLSLANAPSCSQYLHNGMRSSDNHTCALSGNSHIFFVREQLVCSKALWLWPNGPIVRLKSANAATQAKDPNKCLQFGKIVVDHLSEGSSCHSVSEIVFLRVGYSLIYRGGSTNARLSKGKLAETRTRILERQ